MKIPEKLPKGDFDANIICIETMQILADKIDEIIDYLQDQGADKCQHLKEEEGKCPDGNPLCLVIHPKIKEVQECCEKCRGKIYCDGELPHSFCSCHQEKEEKYVSRVQEVWLESDKNQEKETEKETPKKLPICYCGHPKDSHKGKDERIRKSRCHREKIMTFDESGEWICPICKKQCEIYMEEPSKEDKPGYSIKYACYHCSCTKFILDETVKL